MTDVPNFPDLQIAVADAFQAGLVAIKSADKGIVLVRLRGYSNPSYERTLDNTFEIRDSFDVSFDDFTSVRLADLAPEECRPAYQYIFASNRIANIFTGNHSGSNGNNIVDPIEVLNTMFRVYLVRMDLNLVLYEPAFDAVYREIEAELVATSIAQVSYVPIVGLELVYVDSIDLGEGVTLRRMPDDEISLAIEMSALLTSPFGGGGVRVSSSNQFAVVFTGSIDYGPNMEIDVPPPDMSAVAHRFVAAVRLAVGGSLSVSRWLTKVAPTVLRMPFGAAASARSVLEIDLSRPCIVTGPEQVQAIQGIYDLVDDERLDRLSLNIAVSRFRESAVGRSPEDRLIDPIIAAESLCGDDSPTELRFKLGLRMSIFVCENNSDFAAAELHRFIGEVYDTRSKVVHGGKKSRKQKKTPTYPLLGGETTSELASTVDQFELLLSSLIRSLIEMDDLFSPDGSQWWNQQLWARLGRDGAGGDEPD